ncbi:catechol 2,3-dioxygenase-like lactoylglutathione lyase family enzyme [Variovorax boronicumulans]|uniref:VOC family protein n=1 Tax=Variovorax boronicumulans TaxID=436515 RepID=UPI00278A25F5|nr:VOC family protein [Variovorax boronicumulans]MDP9920542.1 catechol 2,3-dioxygenase-like lactoylglutathione lyase family enzyme [Variovorax boronicumulans]
MPLTDLNHFLVLTQDIEASRRFYIDALGMRDAPRPWAPFPGAWLAIGSQVCLHLAQANDDPAMLHHFGRSPGETLHGSGAVDHIAFYASDLQEFEQRLTRQSIPYRRRSIPQSSLEQIFVDDPDGVTIELNFPADALGSARGTLPDGAYADLTTAFSDAPDAATRYREIARFVDTHLRPVLFSINARVGRSMRLQRVYSSDEHAYPVGGTKDKEGTHFGETVLRGGQVLSSDGVDAIRQNFDDHRRILDLGGMSLLNVPIVADGACIGVLNAVLREPAVQAQQVELMQAVAGILAPGLRMHAVPAPDTDPA